MVKQQLPRTARIANTLKTSLALDSALAVAIRIVIVTSLLSTWGLAVRDETYKKLYGGVNTGDLVLVVWVLISTATFFPCSLLIDLGMCGWMMYDIRYCFVAELFAEFLGITSTWTLPNGALTYGLYLDFFLEFLAIIFIGFLRLVGVVIALCELYGTPNPDTTCGARKPSQSLFQLIVLSRYDWWTFRALPETFLARKWYRRFLRPIASPSTAVNDQCITPWADILFGVHTFRCRRGESTWFTLTRGISAVVTLCCLGAYAINVTLLQPSEEIKAMPMQLQRSSSMPSSNQMDQKAWGVVLGINILYMPLARDLDLSSIITVVAVSNVAGKELPRCSSEEVKLKGSSQAQRTKWDVYRLIAFTCPQSQYVGTGGDPLVLAPEILVSVDYARLNVSVTNFVSERGVKVWARHSMDVPALLSSSQPTTLVVGNRVYASAQMAVRTVYSDPAWATVGFGSTQRMHFFGTIAIIGTDLRAPSDNQSPETGSIRLFKEFQSADYQMYVDVRHHSILSGVSALGGLSIFFNSFFVILFGGSLMFVFLDAKPLSVFGLLHSVSKKSLSRRLKQEFPRLSSEGGKAGDADAGILAFVKEYMLDTTIIARKRVEPVQEPALQDTASVCSSNEELEDQCINNEEKWSSTASIHPIQLPNLENRSRQKARFFLRR